MSPQNMPQWYKDYLELKAIKSWFNGYECEQPPGVAEDIEAWPAAVHGVAKSQAQQNNWTTTKLRRSFPSTFYLKAGDTCPFCRENIKEISRGKFQEGNIKREISLFPGVSVQIWRELLSEMTGVCITNLSRKPSWPYLSWSPSYNSFFPPEPPKHFL